MPRMPVQLDDDETSVKSCATTVFRWFRKGIGLAEDAPELMKNLADDVKEAWKDSAKS